MCYANPAYQPPYGRLGFSRSQVPAPVSLFLSRHRPAKLFGNAFAFHVSLAPTGAYFQNLDATRYTYPVHRRCVATGKATLVVNSTFGHASGSLEHQPLAVSATKGTNK